MNSQIVRILFGCGVSALALSTPLRAQEAAIPGAESQVEDIVVTAQRRAERLQDVPVTVTAVTAKQVDDLKLQRFEDVQSLSPGLALDRTGRVASSSLRGVTFNPDSNASPTIDTYFNEVPLDPQFQYQSIFDVQQIEVLRGPQGLLRGRPAPVGAITLVTRRPDYDEAGGTVNATYTSFDAVNLQGAVSVPIVPGKVAVRIAGLYDKIDVNGVRNVNQDEKSRRVSRGLRGTLVARPVDNVELTLTHNSLRVKSRSFTAVEGPGIGTNGPAISDGRHNRIAVSEGPASFPVKLDLTVFNAVYSFGKNGHLVYNFGRVNARNEALNDGDTGNAIPNYGSVQYVSSPEHVRTHELRFENTASNNIVEYTIGLWRYRRRAGTIVNPQPPNLRPGAFGSPSSPIIQTPDLRYALPIDISIPIRNHNDAVFGNVVVNLTDRTSVSAGARYFREVNSNSQTVNVGSGLQAVTIPTPCQFLPAPFTGTSSYEGTCDLKIAASTVTQSSRQKNKDWVYGASIRHKFSEDILTYFSYGHSFRAGGITVGVRGVPDDILFYKPETSNSFEIGIKTEWFNRRLRVNLSLFRQNFKGYINTSGFTIPYISQNADGSVTLNNTGGFTFNADAYSEGAELEIAAQPTDTWSLLLNVANAKGQYKGVSIPCRDSNNDGTPDNLPLPSGYRPLNGATYATCTSSASINNQSRWTMSAQSEIFVPIGDGNTEVYLRGLLNYRSKANAQTYTVKSYTILNAFVGVRRPNWDIGVFARNLFNSRPLLSDRNAPLLVNADPLFPTGYRAVNYLRGREAGISARFSFGSD